MLGGYKYCPPLTKSIKCDVLIVGGGFSGVSAAAQFLRKGLSVVLIEKNIIGGLIGFGVVGLFIGPVILAVTYTLLESWVRNDKAGAQ